MSKKQPKEDIEMKTYILDLRGDGQRRITVPASWKVTFGPIVPGARADRRDVGTLALRFYEGKDQQRAIFTDVRSFRDSSIKLEEKITKIQEKVLHAETDDGVKNYVVQAKESSWRNADLDDIDDKQKRLPVSLKEVNDLFEVDA